MSYFMKYVININNLPFKLFLNQKNIFCCYFTPHLKYSLKSFISLKILNPYLSFLYSQL